MALLCVSCDGKSSWQELFLQSCCKCVIVHLPLITEAFYLGLTWTSKALPIQACSKYFKKASDMRTLMTQTIECTVRYSMLRF